MRRLRRVAMKVNAFSRVRDFRAVAGRPERLLDACMQLGFRAKDRRTDGPLTTAYCGVIRYIAINREVGNAGARCGLSACSRVGQ
jgi:hypothetical protein